MMHFNKELKSEAIDYRFLSVEFFPSATLKNVSAMAMTEKRSMGNWVNHAF